MDDGLTSSQMTEMAIEQELVLSLIVDNLEQIREKYIRTVYIPMKYCMSPSCIFGPARRPQLVH